MDREKRKQMIYEYKNRTPEMGVLSYECIKTNEVFLGTANDIKAKLNSNKVKLNSGSYPNKYLQELWNKYGADSFEIKIYKRLEIKSEEDKEKALKKLDELLEECLSSNAKAKRMNKKRN
ncbi:GIY-YIG nuclease family protein [Anaerofustis stercorihominis]|uniref:GIY-YIG nuclease family protein n=1 Tax=Anaerofustis stercorihominis TaxID=214853 RepID=A0A3E3DZU5_9FIRM|nr:GIY-YIG nuclease family protein [Anaerofustis stercorihominis]RGD74449.1 GIY-YIG nuclease family protein [Anaerofustis stercorihominis]